MRSLRRICVYCASSNHVDERFFTAAERCGASLARRGIGVVYGGGRVGLMGRLADGALAAGGEVIGVIPRKLQELELGHEGCTALHVVETMHERKALMAELSDAFIALPGGVGTLEELFEALTWTQLRFHDKPVGLLNVDGYYDPILSFLRRAAKLRFLREQHRDLLQHSDSLDDLIERLLSVDLPELDGWIGDP